MNYVGNKRINLSEKLIIHRTLAANKKNNEHGTDTNF